MPKDDEKVAALARRFVRALEDLDAEGGDHAAKVADLRAKLEAAVQAEGKEE